LPQALHLRQEFGGRLLALLQDGAVEAGGRAGGGGVAPHARPLPTFLARLGRWIQAFRCGGRTEIRGACHLAGERRLRVTPGRRGGGVFAGSTGVQRVIGAGGTPALPGRICAGAEGPEPGGGPEVGGQAAAPGDGVVAEAAVVL